jgi:prolyl oligopeptidase
MRALVALLFMLISAFAAAAAVPEPPVAPIRSATDIYWGVRVEDPYQYMENLTDPEVVAWADGQNVHTRNWLAAQSGHDSILARVVALTHSPAPRFSRLSYRAGTFFAIEALPDREQPFLVAFPSIDDTTGIRVLTDPNAIDPSGSTTIDFYVPSLDGRFVAVSVSREGTEDGTLTFFDVATGHPLPDRIPRVNGGTAGGSAAWNASGSGVYYTRYPREGERPPGDLPFYQQVWFHRLGDRTEKDRIVLGEGLPKIAEIALETRGDGRVLLVDVGNGDGGEHEFWLIPLEERREGGAIRIAGFKDRVVMGRIGLTGDIYLLSRDGAPTGKILRLPIAAIERKDRPTPDGKAGPLDRNAALTEAEVVVPPSEAAITDFVPMATRIYETDMWGGPSRLRMFDPSTQSPAICERGGVSTFSSLVPIDGDSALVRIESYTEPATYFQIGARASGCDALKRTAIADRFPADFGDCEVRREFAVANDGKQIPVTIVMRKGTPLDGSNPLLLSAYGCYGFSQRPGFDASRRVWIERGGIWAVAGIRGGGEYGDTWHRAAYRETKKVSFSDFSACARYLIQAGYTNPGRFAIEGGSAGGLLMYGAMIQNPDLFRAVVARVGMSDMLRVELSPNGRFNTTEFGTVKDEVQFGGLYAYSPYLHVLPGARYPALLATTGMNDPRVDPWHSFKMVARLQAASASGNPILLRVSGGTGHGGGTARSKRDRETADIYTFLFAMLR